MSLENKKESFLHKAATFIHDHYITGLGVISFILISYSGYALTTASVDDKILSEISITCKDLYNNLNNKTYDKAFWILIAGIIIGVAHTVFSKRHEKTLLSENAELKVKESTLNEQLEKLSQEKNKLEDSIIKIQNDFFDNFKVKLASVSSKPPLNLDNESRISVYRHENDKYFTMIGRYSVNPYYDKSGRRFYPDNEGYISKAWRNGSFKKQGLPKYIKKEENKYFNAITNDANIKRAVLKKLKMKSSCYYIGTIIDDTKHKQIAIVVIESVNPVGLDFDKIDSIFEKLSEEIKRDLNLLKRIEPSLEFAKKFDL